MQPGHEERERFSLPTRKGLGGTGRFGRAGRNSPEAAPSQEEPALPQRRGGRDGGPAAADGQDTGAHPSGSYHVENSDIGSYGTGSSRRGSQDTGGYPSSSYDIGNYDIGSSDTGSTRRGSPDNGEFPGGSYDSGGYPAVGYDAGGGQPVGYDAGGGQPVGYDPGGRRPVGYDAGGGQPVGYDAGGRRPVGYDPGGRQPVGYSGGDGDDSAPAPGRERRRGRRPSHARATKPETPRPGSAGPGQQPRGGQADDDAALSPLPPLPPLTPRRGHWDEPDPHSRDSAAHDDQGDADW